MFALWDAEEDGLLGSRYYVDHPVIPLEQTVTYLNLDIAGANLGPSLRSTTFAVGAESGGDELVGVVDRSFAASTLQGEQLSAVFGLYRSDYAAFLGKQVPTVFFTDSTGPCYHTPKDDEFAVDWTKLDQQADVLWRTAKELATSSGVSMPMITPEWENRPLTTYADAVRLRAVVDRSLPGWDRYPPGMVADIQPHLANLDRVIAEGAGAYDETDQSQVLGAASTLVSMMTYGDCDPFLD
ncbi:MAG: M28 family peptidase [Microthrixaceae bacterium]|nr:M28 family peptidase [Microthrixaceae bacterium]